MVNAMLYGLKGPCETDRRGALPAQRPPEGRARHKAQPAEAGDTPRTRFVKNPILQFPDQLSDSLIPQLSCRRPS